MKRSKSHGFTAVAVLAILAVVLAVGCGGWYVWHKNQSGTQAKQSNSKTTKTATQPNDPYAGWKTNCDAGIAACYKYPDGWTADQYGAFENPANTAYFRYQDPDNKDSAASEVYIASVDKQTAAPDLTVVGSADATTAGFTMYSTSQVTDVQVGQTVQLVTSNPSFVSKNNDVTFVCGAGINFANADQAKAWFSTSDAQTCLKILQSFYYQ